MEAIEQWRKTERWWPALSELDALIDRREIVELQELARGGDRPTAEAQEDAWPINAHWWACMDAMIGAFGERDFKAWLLTLTPVNDDGETLSLAAPTLYIADYVAANYQEQLEEVIGRKIEFVTGRPEYGTWAELNRERWQRMREGLPKSET